MASFEDAAQVANGADDRGELIVAQPIQWFFDRDVLGQQRGDGAQITDGILLARPLHRILAVDLEIVRQNLEKLRGGPLARIGFVTLTG